MNDFWLIRERLDECAFKTALTALGDDFIGKIPCEKKDGSGIQRQSHFKGDDGEMGTWGKQALLAGVVINHRPHVRGGDVAIIEEGRTAGRGPEAHDALPDRIAEKKRECLRSVLAATLRETLPGSEFGESEFLFVINLGGVFRRRRARGFCKMHHDRTTADRAELDVIGMEARACAGDIPSHARRSSRDARGRWNRNASPSRYGQPPR